MSASAKHPAVSASVAADRVRELEAELAEAKRKLRDVRVVLLHVNSGGDICWFGRTLEEVIGDIVRVDS